MKTFQIDALTGDLAFSAGTLVPLDREDALVQRIRSRLRLIRGEWFLDTSKGLPWDTIFTKNPNLGLIEAEIRTEVEDVDGVDSVTEVRIVVDRAARTAVVSLRVTSDLGELLEIQEAF